MCLPMTNSFIQKHGRYLPHKGIYTRENDPPFNELSLALAPHVVTRLGPPTLWW